MSGLYIHVPFCVRKCRYCDFYSLPVDPDAEFAEEDKRERYLDALHAELKGLPDGFEPETVYIGGGTPTVLGTERLRRLLDMVREAIDPSRTGEWTCEANPGTVDRDKANLMKDAGVNRISLGVQSFDLRNLSFLGRIHSAGEAEGSYGMLREAGFGNINLDLMYAIPGSSQDVLRSDLEAMVALAPEHVACYCLTFEEGTPLTIARDKGKLAEVGEAEAEAEYRLVRDMLKEAGYVHYEISNFACPEKECRHNLLYWGPGEYIGCGPSAHSHWRGVRWGNAYSLDTYCTKLLDGSPAREFEEELQPEAKAREILVMSLRRIEGVSRKAFREQTGFDYHDLLGPEIERLRADGLLVEEGDRVRLAENALFISDTVFRELV